MSSMSRQMAQYWLGYLGSAILLGTFAAIIAGYLGAPEGVRVLVAIAVGGLAVAFVIVMWFKERSGQHT